MFDLARHLVGELERVAATTATWIAERPVATTSRAFEAVRSETATAPVDVDDSAYILGRFAGGAIGTFELSRSAPGRKNHLALEIHGSRGSIAYDYERANEVQLCLDDDAETAGFRRVLMGPAQDDGALLPFPGLGVGFAESIVFQIRDFPVAVAGGPPMAPDFYDGWRALEQVAEAVLAAAGPRLGDGAAPTRARGMTGAVRGGPPRFAGRVAVVTGAGAGLGALYVTALAREGAAVVVVDRNAAGAERTAEATRAAGGECRAVMADLRREDNVARMAEAALGWRGRIDVLVNNAGGGSSRRRAPRPSRRKTPPPGRPSWTRTSKRRSCARARSPSR